MQILLKIIIVTENTSVYTVEAAFNRRKNYSCWIHCCNFTYRNRYLGCLSLWRTLSNTLYLVLQNFLQNWMTRATLTSENKAVKVWNSDSRTLQFCPSKTAKVLNFKCNSLGIVYNQQNFYKISQTMSSL